MSSYQKYIMATLVLFCASWAGPSKAQPATGGLWAVDPELSQLWVVVTKPGDLRYPPPSSLPYYLAPPPNTSCQPQTSASVKLEMHGIRGTLVLLQEFACQPLVGTKSFSVKPVTSGALTRVAGWLERDGEYFPLLYGQTDIIVVSQPKPLRYQVRFQLRLATEANHKRFMDGEILRPDEVIEIDGQASFEPVLTCTDMVGPSSVSTRYSMNGKAGECHRLLGLHAFTSERVPSRRRRIP